MKLGKKKKNRGQRRSVEMELNDILLSYSQPNHSDALQMRQRNHKKLYLLVEAETEELYGNE